MCVSACEHDVHMEATHSGHDAGEEDAVAAHHVRPRRRRWVRLQRRHAWCRTKKEVIGGRLLARLLVERGSFPFRLLLEERRFRGNSEAKLHGQSWVCAGVRHGSGRAGAGPDNQRICAGPDKKRIQAGPGPTKETGLAGPGRAGPGPGPGRAGSETSRRSQAPDRGTRAATQRVPYKA